MPDTGRNDALYKRNAWMKKPLTNIPESIRARITNIARDEKKDFGALLLQYFQERLLYRLSISPHAERFTLKGGLVFLVYSNKRGRPTKDIDLLGNINLSDPAELISLFQDITAIQGDDGLTFDANSISATPINENEAYEYPGIQLRIMAYLGNASIPLSIDVGIGDIVYPAPQKVSYPVLLDHPAPVLRVYSKESVIAEKFETMIKLGMINSRLKDFYDIWFLAGNFLFNAVTLHTAITQTLEQRHTRLADRSYIFADNFRNNPEKQRQWSAFLSKNRLSAEPSFSVVMVLIEQFLEPICRGLVPAGIEHNWDHDSRSWEKIPV